MSIVCGVPKARTQGAAEPLHWQALGCFAWSGPPQQREDRRQVSAREDPIGRGEPEGGDRTAPEGWPESPADVVTCPIDRGGAVKVWLGDESRRDRKPRRRGH